MTEKEREERRNRRGDKKKSNVSCAEQKQNMLKMECLFVRSISGIDLAIVSDSEKHIYREIEESMKRDSISKRDEW